MKVNESDYEIKFKRFIEQKKDVNIKYYPLSIEQETLWLDNALFSEEEKDALVLTTSFLINGEIVYERLKRTFLALLVKHPMLSCRVVLRDDIIIQEQMNILEQNIEYGDYDDISYLSLDEINVHIEESFRNVIDVETKGIDFKLFKLSKNKYRFVIYAHHVICDAGALVKIIQEFFTLYEKVHKNQLELSKIEPVCRNIDAVFQRRNNQFINEKAIEYWKDKFNHELDEVSIPQDFVHPQVETGYGKLLIEKIEGESYTSLYRLSKKLDVSPFVILISTFKLLLHKLSQSNNIPLFIALSARDDDTKDEIGYFVNSLPTVMSIDTESSFEEFTAVVQKAVKELSSMRSYPFSEVNKLFDYDRTLPYHPLLRFITTYTRHKPLSKYFGDSEFTYDPIRTVGNPGRDLSLVFDDNGSEVSIDLTCNSDIFKDKTARSMLNRYTNLLEEVLENPNSIIKDLSILSQEEKVQFLKYNETKTDYDKSKTIHQLFEEQVQKVPKNIALVFEGKELSYRELNEKVNQLAHHLIEEGIEEDELVGLCVERSIEMIIGILAILKAGGAYVAIDPSYPKERIEFIINDSKAKLVLTQERLKQTLESVSSKQVYIDSLDLRKYSLNNPKVRAKANNLAYVIYTSGTTGKPKGIILEHKVITNLVQWHNSHLKNSITCNVLQFASINFDVSVQEIFTTLANGLSLHLINKDMHKDMSALASYISSNHIHRLFIPYVVVEHLVDAFSSLSLENNNLQEIITAGEQLKISKEIREFFLKSQGCSFINHYGPSETHVVTSYKLDADVNGWNELPPIGKAISNTQLYILDKNNKVVPHAVAGELCISGDGLARGYLNQVELSAKTFIDNPFTPNTKMYKSGDLVRYGEDGNIEYLGRIDDQVKVRGFRIELGEIEQQLLGIDGIKESIVLVKEDENGHKALAGYIVIQKQISMESIKSILSQQLPEYMIPSVITILEAMPLTANGKADKKTLAKLNVVIKSSNEYVGPRNEMEKELVDIFSQILKVKKIGINDNFFELGGHSLLATQLVSKIRKNLKLQLPLKELFSNPTVDALHSYLKVHAVKVVLSEDIEDIVRETKSQYNPFSLNLIQQAYYIGRGNDIALGSTASYLYYEIQSNKLDLARLEMAWNKVISRHEMLRCIFNDDITQQILQSVPYLKILKEDFSGLDNLQVEAALKEERVDKLNRVTDLNVWPLITLDAYKLPQNKVRVHLYLDALICDSSSMFLFFNDLKFYYDNPDKNLPALEVGFKDYLRYEEEYNKGPQYKKSLAYWKARLDSLPNGPELPLVANSSTVKKPVFTIKSYKLNKNKWKTFKDNLSSIGITPTVLLLTFYAKVLEVWANNSHFCLTLTLNERIKAHKQVEQILGEFTSTILLEIDASAQKTLEVLAKEIQRQLLDDIDHKEVGAIEVIRELRSKGKESLMPVVFTSTLGLESTLDNAWMGETKYWNSQTPQVWVDNQTSEVNGELIIRWSCLENLFEANILSEMFQAYTNLVDSFVQGNTFLNDNNIDFVSQRQLSLRKEYNKTKKALNLETLPSQFMNISQKYPKREAIISSEHCLSYQELHNASSQVAEYIEGEKLESNSHVAIILPKGWEQVVGIMGSGYAGKPYLPIDIEAPKNRIKLILSQAKVKIIISNQEIIKTLELNNKFDVLDIDKLVNLDKNYLAYDVKSKEEELAYTIFTSGSTGKPKGVMISHENVCNTVMDINERFKVNEEDKIFAVSALNFDLSVYDVYGALSSGACIVLPKEEDRKNPSAWLDLATKNKVSIWNSVPAIVSLLCDEASSNTLPLPKSLRLILMSGDFIPINLIKEIKKLSPKCETISLGGATEGSIWSIYYPINDTSIEKIPYGYPLSNQEIHILDSNKKTCPDYVHGEIYIKGKGVAQGYLHDDLRTQEQFQIDTTSGDILYKTGDMGYFNSKGYIEIIGRLDDQVKIQGYRVELGEIEQQLLNLNYVEEAIVLDKKESNDSKVLVAYIVGKNNQTIDTESIKNTLSQYLPKYMIPSAIQVLNSLPLTSNGKIDKKFLRNMDVALKLKNEYIAARNEVEEELEKIFSLVLNIENIGMEDDFFELGGNSLLAISLLSRINKHFKTSLSLTTIFQASNISKLNQLIKEGNKVFDILLPIQIDGNKTPIYAVPGIGGTGLEFELLSRTLGTTQPFYGLQSVGFDGTCSFLPTVEAIAQANVKAIKKFQPQGPYKIIGFSFGGTVAFEMARILGNEIDGIMMLDTFPHSTKSFFGKFLLYIKKIDIIFLMKHYYDQLLNKKRGRSLIMKKVINNNYICGDRYKARPIQDGISMALICTDYKHNDMDLEVAWEGLAGNSMSIYKLDGTHMDIIQEEGIEKLSSVVNEYFNTN